MEERVFQTRTEIVGGNLQFFSIPENLLVDRVLEAKAMVDCGC